MSDIQDLHIDAEILPLFDFTHNDFSKKALISLMSQPLESVADIVARQDILRGFLENNSILKPFSYSRVDFMEVFDFVEGLPGRLASRSRLKLQLQFSEKDRHKKRGKLIQFVLLIHRLQTFFALINTRFFPESYKTDLQNITTFLASFNPGSYEILIRNQGLRIRHMVDLTEQIAEKSTTGEVQKFWKDFFLFEAYLSLSIGISKHGFTFPTFSKETFSLEGFYHPLLANPVANNLETSNNVVLVTGPNMSGKSTFLKPVSLCVYLGHLGLGVPASKAEFPFFDAIYIFINLNDDILSGYSHFMTEVINLKKVLTEVTQGATCFAAFDELFRGTNIEDAVEISTTTIKGLTKFTNSLFLISTHLHQLKEVEEVKTRKVASYFLDCELKDNSPNFLYNVKEGWSDLKVGRILFENEGLNRMLG